MMSYFGYRVTQKVAISVDVALMTHFRGLRLKSRCGMLTLIRVGSLKLLHVILQNNLNT